MAESSTGTVWIDLGFAGSGTEIELTVPAAHAYAASARHSWFTENLAGKDARGEP